MNADGSKNRFLTKGSDAEWSPDGTRIAYIAEGEPKAPQVFVRWMTENAATQITQVQHPPSNLRWSPDGKQIALDDARAKGGEVGHPAAEATRRREVDEGARGDRQAALPAGPCRIHRGRLHAPLCRARGWRHSASADLRRLERGRQVRRHGRNRRARLDSRRPDDRRRRPRRAGRGSPLSGFGRVCD